MHRVSLCLEKGDPWRYLGHRDWVRVLVRSLVRAGLPLALTEGFRPHPKLALPEPLPLGVASEGEVFLVRLTEPWTARQVGEALAPCLPAGMSLVWAEEGDHREPMDQPLTLAVTGVEAPWLLARTEDLVAAEGLAAAEAWEQEGAVRLRLVPTPGRRVSVGRVLRSLAAEAPGESLLEARRLLGPGPATGDCNPGPRA